MLFTDVSGTKKKFAKDPAVVHWQGRYYLYYSVFLPDGEGKEVLGIGIAASDDMEHWKKLGNFPLTQPCEKNGVGAPGAIVLGGKIHLFYQTYGNGEKDAICHAWSEDGRTFEKDDTNPVFSPSDTWCCGRAIDADVCAFGDRVYLYFATRDHEMEVQKVGVASAAIDGGFGRGEWRECLAQSVVAPEYKWEGRCIEAPAALEEGAGFGCSTAEAIIVPPSRSASLSATTAYSSESCPQSPSFPTGRRGAGTRVNRDIPMCSVTTTAWFGCFIRAARTAANPGIYLKSKWIFRTENPY